MVRIEILKIEASEDPIYLWAFFFSKTPSGCGINSMSSRKGPYLNKAPEKKWKKILFSADEADLDPKKPEKSKNAKSQTWGGFRPEKWPPKWQNDAAGGEHRCQKRGVFRRFYFWPPFLTPFFQPISILKSTLFWKTIYFGKNVKNSPFSGYFQLSPFTADSPVSRKTPKTAQKGPKYVFFAHLGKQRKTGLYSVSGGKQKIYFSPKPRKMTKNDMSTSTANLKTQNKYYIFSVFLGLFWEKIEKKVKIYFTNMECFWKTKKS